MDWRQAGTKSASEQGMAGSHSAMHAAASRRYFLGTQAMRRGPSFWNSPKAVRRRTSTFALVIVRRRTAALAVLWILTLVHQSQARGSRMGEFREPTRSQAFFGADYQRTREASSVLTDWNQVVTPFIFLQILKAEIFIASQLIFT